TTDGHGKPSGGQIWVPGQKLVDSLHDQVSSGSISLETLSTIKEAAIGSAAFALGLLEGALKSLADIFIGIYDLVKLAVEIQIKMFQGTIIADALALWEDIKKIRLSDIIDLVGAKWNAPSTWDRWNFRGYVIGYAIMEIVTLFFAGGIANAIKWVGKL